MHRKIQLDTVIHITFVRLRQLGHTLVDHKDRADSVNPVAAACYRFTLEPSQLRRKDTALITLKAVGLSQSDEQPGLGPFAAARALTVHIPDPTKYPRGEETSLPLTVFRSAKGHAPALQVVAQAVRAARASTPSEAPTLIAQHEPAPLADTHHLVTAQHSRTVAEQLTTPRTSADRGLVAHDVSFNIGKDALLSRVSLSAAPGTLTAIIGPSGAGKTSLLRILAGSTAPSTGWVALNSQPMQSEYPRMRGRIGVVPQDDVLHTRLTVDQALQYAARLRLPDSALAEPRDVAIERVLDELGLTPHRHKRIDKLSGGQRKRASVALELLTQPHLLLLDEPTSGLDPALDRQIMMMLRRLADAGRVVVVVTHSLSYLHFCDQVLLLGAGGRAVYLGPPSDIKTSLGTPDWADIFAMVSMASGVDASDVAHTGERKALCLTSTPAPSSISQAKRPNYLRHCTTVARRQFRLIAADRGYLSFLTLMPFVMGILTLIVPGSTGLGFADKHGPNPNEPSQILVLLTIAAVFMGTALTVRDLVGERPIFERERAVGLSASSYLAAKIITYSLLACAQAAVLTSIVVIGKGTPHDNALLVGNTVVELYLVLASTAVVSTLVGLAMSSCARTTEQILPMLVIAIMVSIVFCGGLIPVTGRVGLEHMSWLMPARWGFAAAASLVDLRAVAPFAPGDEQLWTHTLRWFLADLGCLGALGGAFATFVRYRLRGTEGSGLVVKPTRSRRTL